MLHAKGSGYWFPLTSNENAAWKTAGTFNFSKRCWEMYILRQISPILFLNTLHYLDFLKLPGKKWGLHISDQDLDSKRWICGPFVTPPLPTSPPLVDAEGSQTLDQGSLLVSACISSFFRWAHLVHIYIFVVLRIPSFLPVYFSLSSEMQSSYLLVIY